jgi:hypothetical protein
MLRVMGRVVRGLAVRGVLPLGLASVVYSPLARDGGNAADRYGEAMVHMIVALNTRTSVRTHPVVRLGVRGETEGEFDVVAVVPRIAVPRVGDVVRGVTDPANPARHRYAGPSA